MNIEKMPDGSLFALFRSRWADNIYKCSPARQRAHLDTATAHRTAQQQLVSPIYAARQRPFGHRSQRHQFGTSHRAAVSHCTMKSKTTPTYRRNQTTVELEPVSTGKRAFWGTPRAPMTLAISEDNGKTWPLQAQPGDGRRLLHVEQLENRSTASSPTRRSSKARMAPCTSPIPTGGRRSTRPRHRRLGQRLTSSANYRKNRHEHLLAT